MPRSPRRLHALGENKVAPRTALFRGYAVSKAISTALGESVPLNCHLEMFTLKAHDVHHTSVQNKTAVALQAQPGPSRGAGKKEQDRLWSEEPCRLEALHGRPKLGCLPCAKAPRSRGRESPTEGSALRWGL